MSQSCPIALVLEPLSHYCQAEAEKKTPKLLARILAPFKGDGKKAEKKEKSPKSPKKKKKDDTEVYSTLVSFVVPIVTYASCRLPPPAARNLPKRSPSLLRRLKSLSPRPHPPRMRESHP